MLEMSLYAAVIHGHPDRQPSRASSYADKSSEPEDRTEGDAQVVVGAAVEINFVAGF